MIGGIFRRHVLLGSSMVLALFLSACGQLPQDPLLRQLERKSGLIVYVGADGNIYTIDQGGGSKQAITTDASMAGDRFELYRFPTWSRDGQQIAFAKLGGSQGSVDSSGVFTANLDDLNLTETYTSDRRFPIYLYWSPDNEHVSFLTSAESGGLVLQMVPAQGGVEPKVLDAGSPYYWSWSPDGQSLLVHAGAATEGRLSFLNVNGEVVEEGLSLRPTTFQAPAWSPDGSQLLLAAETDDGSPALMLTDPHGSVKSILKLLDGSAAFGWSPDGKRVAYIATDGSQELTIGPLAVVDPEKPAEMKTSEQDDVFGFFWSPDSRKVAYFVPAVFAPTPEPNQTEAPNPVTLLQLYMLDAASGQASEVVTFLPTDDFLNMMRYFDQYQHSVTIWSPDSKNLVLSGYMQSSDANADLGIWVVSPSGNLEPRFLMEGTLAFWSWK